MVIPHRRYDMRFDSWYSKFTCAKLKELCQAAGLPYSGTKDAMVSRLAGHDLGRRFAWERSSQHAGLTNQDLRDMCSGRGIAKSGGRFELVCRLFRHENQSQALASASTGASKKRAPLGETASTAPKKKRPSKTQVLYNRIQRKIKSGSSAKKYQSHMGAKSHSEDVYELISQTLQKEITSKSYESNSPKKALELAKACFVSLSDNFKSIIMPGYDMTDYLGDSICVLEHIIENSVDLLNSEELEDTESWVNQLQLILGPYDFGAAAFERMTVTMELAWLEDEPENNAVPVAAGSAGTKENDS